MSTELKDAQVSLRLPVGLREKLDQFAQLTGRSRNHLAVQALGDYLHWRVPQIQDLKEAIAAADDGEFADDAEVDATFARLRAAAANEGASSAPKAARRRR